MSPAETDPRYDRISSKQHVKVESPPCYYTQAYQEERSEPKELAADPASLSPSDEAAKPSPPPDGGIVAWLHVLGGFMLCFNTWGILNAFGVYQTYYESGALFHETSSNISWIGSLASLILFIVGCVTGPIYDRGYLRSLLVTGTALVVLGHMMLSLCRQFWQVVLAQGLVIGLGAGCLFVPFLGILPEYFSKRLGLATGIGVVGSSIGGIIYPITLFRLINRIGFGWATRVLGFIALATQIPAILILRRRLPPPAKARQLIDWTAFRDLTYMSLVASSLVAFMGCFVLLFYLSFYAADQHITSASLAFYLVPVFNAGSCFGRGALNALSDKTGPFNLLVPGSFLTGILQLCMIGVKGKGDAPIIVLAVLSGFSSGVLVGILPLCFVAITRDKSKLGTRMGMAYSMIGLGCLAGGPGAGSILRSGNSSGLNWDGMWAFGGVSCIVAGCGYASIRVARAGWSLGVKA